MSVAQPECSTDPGADAADDHSDRPDHLRPRTLRRETSQILSYYQSADAGHSDEYDGSYFPGTSVLNTGNQRGAYTQTDSDAGLRCASPLSSYSDSETESVSDYGEELEGCGGQSDATRKEDENSNWNIKRTMEGYQDRDKGGDGDGEGGTDANVQYGIALGSPGGDTATATITDAVSRDGTGIDTGYGSPITSELQPILHASPESPAVDLSLHSTQQICPEQRTRQTQSGPPTSLAPAPTSFVPSAPSVAVDPAADPEYEPEVAPGRRRRMSSRGASDKRRVAIVQVDSGTDVSERETDGEGRESEERSKCSNNSSARGTLSDGFGRGEASAQGQQQALPLHFSTAASSSSAHRLQSTFAVHAAPSLSTRSRSGANPLFLRRGIAGTFALVAPPDASPSAYTNLGYFTPPLSAPASARPTPPLLTRNESADSASTAATNSSSGRRQHQRSQSEAVLTGAARVTSPAANSVRTNSDVTSSTSSSRAGSRRPGHRLRKSSRDIGIVGINASTSPTSGTMKPDAQQVPNETKPHNRSAPDVQAAPLSPIFQTPSRSQTSLLSSDGASSTGPGGPSEQHAQPSSKEAKRRSQQHTANGSSNRTRTSSNGRESRSPRDENINPVAVGADHKQMWNATPMTSTAYSSYATSGTTPTLQQCVIAPQPTASASSPPAVVGMATPNPSSYLYYQPGVHATAGPLPSPPRQILPPARDSPPPPRPPRLHAPNSGSSSLAKRRSDTSINSKQEKASVSAVRHPEVTSPAMTPSTTSSTLVNSQSEDSVKGKGHTREGAFPISSVIVKDATPSHLSVKQEQKQEQQPLKRKNTMDDLVKDVTAAIDEAVGVTKNTSSASPSAGTPSQAQKEPPKEHKLRERRSGMDLKREESRSTFRGGSPLARSPSSNYSDDDYENIADITVTKALPEPLVTSPPTSPRTESQHESPSKPQKIIDFALKRFSALPRPPSRLSASRASPRSSNSHERHSQERPSHEQERTTQSSRQKVVFIAKIRSTYPSAMQFNDVLAKKSPLERSLAYARKINELANHDPGLGEWVVTTKHNLTVPGSASKRKSMSPAAVRSPSERSFTFQPRHPSRGSIGSEMTFPKRVDAYVATDLLQKPTIEDTILPQVPPPQLPYPSLAVAPPTQHQPTKSGGSTSGRSVPSSLSSSKSTGGFFASIGRKASVKKDRPVIGGQKEQPNKLLSKRQQAVSPPQPAPRPVQISASPSLPGGPRAPPGRIQRAQSVIAPKLTGMSSSMGDTDNDVARQKSTNRSPSVAPPSMRNGTGNAGSVTPPDLEQKVGRLADLLPHADRKVLEGYLRRAGGMDMVAIGRYLDDEKNGLLIRD